MKPLQRSGDLWMPAILFVLVGAIYLSFPTRSYYWDGIVFAQAIESAPGLDRSLLHPNHLIYNFVGYVFYRGLGSFGLALRAVTALQILNSLISASTAVLLFYVLRRRLGSVYYAFTLSLLFAFSATWWKYSTDADAYIPSTFFLLLSFSLILPPRKSPPALIGLTYALSLLFHQLAIIAFPVLAFAVFIQDKTLTTRRRLLNLIVFVVASGGITLAAYGYSVYLLTGAIRLRDFWQWTLSYSPDESFGFRPLNNLGFTLRGHGRLFFGGRLNAIRGLVNPFIKLLIAVWAGLFLVLTYKLIRSIKKPGWEWLKVLRQDPERSKTAMICLLWIGVYVIGLFTFAAHNTFYRLFYLPALIILLGLVLDSYQQTSQSSRQYRLAIFVSLLALTNFLTLIFPFAHAEKFPPLAFALEMNRVWPPKTIVYYGSANADNNLVRYFTTGTTWKKLELKHQEELEGELRQASDQGVETWLETSAIDQLSANPTGSAWLQRHSRNGRQRALITNAHNIRFVQIVPAD